MQQRNSYDFVILSNAHEKQISPRHKHVEHYDRHENDSHDHEHHGIQRSEHAATRK